MPPISEQASRICSHCGLCCNGSLYSAVALTPADRSKLIAVAQVPVEATGDLAWLQPCAAHDGSGCTVYDRRPLACRDYHCGVLDSVAAGSLSAGDAVMLVSQVKSLAQSVAARLSAIDTQQQPKPLYQLLNDFDQHVQLLDPAAQRAMDPALLLTVGTLKMMLGKHFKVLEFADEQPPQSP